MTASLPPLPPPNVRVPTRRKSRIGVWLSLVIHVLLVLILVEVTRDGLWWDPPFKEGNNVDRAGGGGGGRQVTMIPIQEAPPKTVTPTVPPPPPVPVPVVTPVQVPPPVPTPPPDTIPKPAESATSTATTSGTGGGTGGGAGTGAGPGTGPGTGPGNGGPGTGGADSARTVSRDPEPRQLILIPFDYPRSMHGLTISVTFFVLANGRVDRVLCSDDISDRGYAKKFEAAMRAYLFRPARSAAGVPVPGHTTVSITF